MQNKSLYSTPVILISLLIFVHCHALVMYEYKDIMKKQIKLHVVSLELLEYIFQDFICYLLVVQNDSEFSINNVSVKILFCILK